MGATHPYRGRFAPSPTGPLHAGSLVAALASWLDARAHGGQWLVRMEDVDTPRCVPGMDAFILQQLATVGLVPDEAPQLQSRRAPLYQQALDRLAADGLAYPCHCSRKAVQAAWQALGQPRQRHGELVYPGTCRPGLAGRGGTDVGVSLATANATPPQWRLRTDISKPNIIHWTDRCLGTQTQDVEHTVGDFPLRRADGCFTYQLAVVVDDAAQGITHVVRGEDLADNTARQILLQQRLSLPTPAYLHTPLVWGDNGEKLSKQNGAQALDTTRPLAALNAAACRLGLAPFDPPGGHGVTGDALAQWVNAWRHSRTMTAAISRQPVFSPARHPE